MRFGKVVGVLAGLMVLAQAAPVSAQSLARRLDLLRLQEQASGIAAAVFQSEGRACPAQLPAMKTLMADRRFGRMDPEARRPFLYAVMMCADVKAPELALDAARRLETIAAEPVEVLAVQAVMISDALQRGDTADAAKRFLALSEAQPAAVAAWEPEMVGVFADYIDEDPDLSLKVAERLTRLPWTNPASQRAARNEWALAYGWQLADRGRLKEAGEAVAAADELYVLLIVAGDRRFAAVWDRFEHERRFDWDARAGEALRRAEQEMAADPGRLRPVQDYLTILRALARYDEAILVGQAFRARLQDGETFTDGAGQGDQLLIALAQALFETGQDAEAEAVFTQAIGAPEDNQPSIDARIAWGGRLLDLGRPDEVLTLMDSVDKDYMTPYGRLWVDSQRACAQADLDSAAAEKTLAILREGQTLNPAALSQALLCLDRIDEAAALLVTRLKSPRHRAGGLDPFWTSRPPPSVPPWLARFERRRQAMLARPEVLRQLDAVGRKVETPLAGDYWGGF